MQTNNFKRVGVVAINLLFLIYCHTSQQKTVDSNDPGDNTKFSLTILYDNHAYVKGAKTQHGFSCLIEGAAQTILFDTGTKPKLLFYNVHLLNIDIEKINWVFLSHIHSDHTGGLRALLKKQPNVKVFFPKSFPNGFVKRIERSGATALGIEQPGQLSNRVYHTGQMGTRPKEMGLILDTEKGSVLITGCAHPGVVEMIQRAKEVLKKDVYMVIGGFHLMNKSNAEINAIVVSFKKLGVEKVAPTHCSGNKAIRIFKKAYGENCITAGVGKTLIF